MELFDTAVIDVGGSASASRFVPPRWYVNPDYQRMKAQRLWAGVQIPDPPANFRARTSTEVLLLHVPDTFMQMYARIEHPANYDMRFINFRMPTSQYCRPNANARKDVTPVWLGFDPGFGLGAAPASLWGGPTQLAAREVLSALIQFPSWPVSWGRETGVYLSGYQYNHEGKWDRVPILGMDTWTREFVLDSTPATLSVSGWSSPSVREV